MPKIANLRTWLVISMALLALLSGSARADGTYSGGSGEPNDPYIISTAADMCEIGTHTEDWNDCFVLTADINLIDYNETNFNIIGPNSATPFIGVFDGNNHAISNFTWNSASTDFVGLFGIVDDPNAEVKDLILIEPNVQGGECVGAMVGYLLTGTIRGCGVEGGVVSGDYIFVGGLVGYNSYDAVISNCYTTTVTVNGNSYVGGLAGCNSAISYSQYGTISNCYATGDISGIENSVGGLVGYNYGTISNSNSAGDVNGAIFVGGLVGENYGTVNDSNFAGEVNGSGYVGGLVGENSGTISNCYAAGLVSGAGYDIGGLVGDNGDTISNCYAIVVVSGNGDVGGLVGSSYNGTILNCYATGAVSGNENVGGLVGDNSHNAAISNCYAIGSVVGNNHVGGFAGYNSGMIYLSFWDTESSGESNGVGLGGSLGLTGKTTTQMYSMSIFLGWAAEPAVWTIDDTNDYPYLAWENLPGIPINSPILSDFITGSGTEEAPYLIYTPNDLDKAGLFFSEWDKHFKLMADIDLSVWSLTEPNVIGSFTGVFDGNGHSISNFTFRSHQDNYIGFLRWIGDPNAKIKDLRLIDPNVQGDGYVGSLVGGLHKGEIAGCDIEGGTVSGYEGIGGLVGHNGDTISNCYTTTGAIDGNHYVGGLAGYNVGTISNSYAAGFVTGDYYVGGLAGRNGGTISNCYATGSVTGSRYTGGLVGYSILAAISNSYATGAVTGSGWYTGGLVGYNYFSSTISNCYTTTVTVNGSEHVGGLVGENIASTILDCYSTAVTVNGSGYVGGLAGYNGSTYIHPGTILNCYTTNGTVNGNNYVGGLVGANLDEYISNSYATGPVSGDYRVGGLAGYSYGDISDCYATGSVTGGDNSQGLGGLAGHNYGNISDCYATGSVTGGGSSQDLGGLVGYNNESTVSNCYAAGFVSGDYRIGGLVGYNDNADIFASLWDTQTTGQPYGVGENFGTVTVETYGRTTAQMKTQATFTAYGWDFVGETINGPNDIWRMCIDGLDYPKLWWEFITGDFICPDGVDFKDFAVFSLAWLSDDTPMVNWNPKCDISKLPDGIIDELDLAVLTENWLTGK